MYYSYLYNHVGNFIYTYSYHSLGIVGKEPLHDYDGDHSCEETLKRFVGHMCVYVCAGKTLLSIHYLGMLMVYLCHWQ
jgi:hypothetical protein